MRNYLKKFLCSKKAKLDTSRVASAGEEMVVERRGQRDSRNGVGRRITHKVLVEKNLRENKQTNQDDTSGSRVGLRIWFFLQQRKRLRVQIPDRPSGKKVYIKKWFELWVSHPQVKKVSGLISCSSGLYVKILNPTQLLMIECVRMGQHRGSSSS